MMCCVPLFYVVSHSHSASKMEIWCKGIYFAEKVDDEFNRLKIAAFYAYVNFCVKWPISAI